MITSQHDIKVAPEFLEYFNNLKQVFLYITDECNLRCIHCLYKPDLAVNRELDINRALSLLSLFKSLGANKLTLIGGEPTRYDLRGGNGNLLTVIHEAKRLGYARVILDTNGQFDSSLLNHPKFQELDLLSFSLDGHTPEINDGLRGNGTFYKCCTNIKQAISLGYTTRITSCVHRNFINQDGTGELSIESMIDLATELGVKEINFHPLFKMGVPRDAWTGETDISPQEWRIVYSKIHKKLDNGEYNIAVRIPLRFISKDIFMSKPEHYSYCPAELGERVLVHPNGILRVCALLIGTPYGIAFFDNEKNEILWNKSKTNELIEHDSRPKTSCVNQKMDFNELVPLCISLKPD